MTDTELDDRADELEVYKGKWRNLYFHKSGLVLHGVTLHSSEEEARDFANTLLKDAAEDKDHCHVWSPPMLSENAPRSIKEIINYTHAIPMPVGEP